MYRRVEDILTNIYRSAISLKQLAVEVNYTVLFNGTCQVVEFIRQSVLQVGVLEAGTMGKCEDLSDFDNGKIVMAR